jgi:putative peptidoglycan lipid II flippase
MALGLYAFRTPIVQLFFERGAFDPRATAVTAYTVQYLSLGILFFGWQDFLSRGFFVLQDSLTPMWVMLGTVVLNIGLNAMLVGPFGLAGLAMGTSISATCAVVVLMYRLRLRLGALKVRELIGSVALTLMTTTAGIVVGRLAYDAMIGSWGGESLVMRAVHLAVGLALVLVVHVVLGQLAGSRDGAMVFDRFSR